MGDPSEWEVVVPPSPEREAERKFQIWSEGQKQKGVLLRPEDVRRDQLFQGSGEGCVIRYLVRKKAP
jgi:hypothetical protein